MAEIKIKIDSSDIDAAIAKVSHLLELVERLPAGLLGTGTESKEVQSESVKVFINEAFINSNESIAESVSIDEIIGNAIANSNEFEKLKAREHCGGYVVNPAFDFAIALGGGRSDLTDAEAEMLKLQRDAPHQFEAKLDGMKDEVTANNATLSEKIRDSIKKELRAGGSIHQAIRNR